jgi:hypothetical protein
MMWQPSPNQLSPASGYWQPPPVSRVSTVAAIVAVGLLGTAILPWINWAFNGAFDFSSSFSLWTVVTQGGTGTLGADWMFLVVAGMIGAALGTIIEAAQRPVSRAPTWMALVGFGGVVIGCCLGLVSGSSPFGRSSSLLSGSFTSTLDYGFWIALVMAVTGVVVSLVRLVEPPNAARQPAFFAPGPWGPPSGSWSPPPGYYPPAPGWPDYAPRGPTPPEYGPLPFGPAQYPAPAFTPPGYPIPGESASGWVPPADPSVAGSSPVSPEGAEPRDRSPDAADRGL